MKRLLELELNAAAGKSATDRIKKNPPVGDPDMVAFHLLVNAHVAGFCMAARFVEKYGDRDPRPVYLRLMMPKSRPTIEELIDDAAKTYQKSKYPTLSVEHTATIKSSFAIGFREGLEFRRAKGDEVIGAELPQPGA